MFETSIFLAVLSWGGITMASGIIGNSAYESFKKSTLFESLKTKCINFFNNENEFDKFVREIQEKKSLNPLKPFRDIEDSFEAVSEKKWDDTLTQEIKEWINDNSQDLECFLKEIETNTSGGNFYIKKQKAQRDINNISNSTVHIK